MSPEAGSTGSSDYAFRFPKLNGNNYGLWWQHMKAALQARFLWLYVTGQEIRPDDPGQPPVKSKVESPTIPPTTGTDLGADSSVSTPARSFDSGSTEYKTKLKEWKAASTDYMGWLWNDQAAMGMMKSASESSQWPHVAKASSSKEMWDIWEDLYVTSQQKVSVHYHFEDLYTRKWDEKTPMADHIALIRDLHQKIIAAGEDFPDVHVARAIVLSLPRSSTWELVKYHCFSQTTLTLDFVTSELTATYLRSVKDSEAQKKEEEVKLNTEKLALLSRSSESSGKKKKKKGGAKPDDECRYCHAKGHWANRCKKRIDDEKAGVAKANVAQASGLVDLGECAVGHLYMVSGPDVTTSRELLLDCAASHHMFCEKKWSVHLSRVENERMKVGDGRFVKVAGRGTVSFNARLGNGVLWVLLHEVMLVPGLEANLVSVGKLQRQGAQFRSVEGGMKVTMDGEDLLFGRMLGSEGTMYHIDVVQSDIASAYVASKASLRLWHQRFGHLNLDQVRQLESLDLVDGFVINRPHEYDHLCEGCALGKSHRLPLPKTSTTKLEKMELVVVDLAGPLNVPTWDGALYALVVVEASCRYPVGRLLKSKESVGPVVQDVLAMMETQSGLKVKRLRSDSGREFVNTQMEAFCLRNGILQETTNPHLPQQNGISECWIAILFDMVRCMLHSAGTDLRYWGEAFMYAVHIRSLSPTSGLTGMVPRQAWTGRKPDVSHLRVFGSVGFANIPKKVHGGKLEVTSLKVRLLGWWTDETKGYRLEDVETGKLITSRDVRFLEDDKPGDLAIIDTPTRGVRPTQAEVDVLIDDALASDLPPDPEAPVSPPAPVEVPPAEALAEAPTPAEDATSDPTPAPDPDPVPPPPPPPKPSKWANLPPRNHPARERRTVQPYGSANVASDAEETYVFDSFASMRAFVVSLSPSNEPRTWNEAMASPDSKQWESALATECGVLERTGTYEWVFDVPDGRTAVGSRLVLKIKRDGDGKITKYKVRIVAKGFLQVPGEDFTETFSSVAKFTTLRIFLTLAALLDLELHQIDVVAAYLQGDLEEEIYMEVPEGVAGKGTKGKFWRLQKALYGLKQAGRQWKVRLDEVMSKLGFEKSSGDDCLYFLREDGKVVLLVLVYVDDMAIAGSKLSKITAFKEDLAKEFEITDLGELKFILGIQVSRDRKARTVSLNQSAYIQQTLTQFGMQDCYPASTPLAVKYALSTSQGPTTAEEHERYRKAANGISYLSLVGWLLFATQTRPDAAFAVGTVAQFGGNPGKAHLEAAKRILRYLKGTKDYCLTLGRRGDDAVNLVGWTDSSWASDPDSRRSIGGFVFEVAGSSVSWSSKKQPTVALSTVEAEYMAALKATTEAIWLWTLLESIGFPQVSATIVHADNQGCIALAHNPVSHSRAKHIDIRHHFIRERIQRGEIELKYVSTHEMLADIFTKQLSGVVCEVSGSSRRCTRSLKHSMSGSDEGRHLVRCILCLWARMDSRR